MNRWSHNAHVVITTYGTWLPGDPRGFRDHDHRVHSSGNHANPPPAGEHAGLYRFAKNHAGDKVVLFEELWPEVADALTRKLAAKGHPIRILSIGPTHAHMLLGAGDEDIKPVIGLAKQAASHRIRARLPGTVWSEGCGVTRIRDEHHYLESIAYIDRHRLEGHLIWIPPELRDPAT